MGSAGGGEHWNASPCRTNVVVNLFFGAWEEACSLAWADDWSDTSGPDMSARIPATQADTSGTDTKACASSLVLPAGPARQGGGRNLRTLFCHGKAFCPSCQALGQEKKAWPRTCQTRSCQSGFYQLTPGSLSFQRTAASRRMRQSRPPAHSPTEPGTLTTTMQPRSVGVA